MSKGRIELVINTRSRKGREALPLLLEALSRAGLRPDRVNKLNKPGSLARVMAGVRGRSPDLLIVGSGDGTVSDIVDYLADTETELGLVPLGTTNNFARSLGVPLELEQAVERIGQGRTVRVDLGLAGADLFANVAGIGLSAQVARSVSNRSKRRFGRLAYALSGLRLLLAHRPFRVRIADKDGELHMHFETHQVIIANGRFHAGRQIARGAKLDSRELVIFKLGGPSRLSFLWHMFDYYTGRLKAIDHSAYLIGRNVTITTDSPQPIELDGEAKGVTPLAVSVRPGVLKVRI